LAGHNVTFDFWVILQHLRLRGDTEGERLWWAIAENNRLHDSMLLDMLVRLAESDEEPVGRNLGELAQEYAGFVIDKEDPYRKRYGEIIGQNWDMVEEGFFQYGAKDAAATLTVYPQVRNRATWVWRNFRGRE